MQILANRFEISSTTAPIFTASAIVGESGLRAVQRSLPIFASGETRVSATFSILTLKPLSADLTRQIVPLTLEIGDPIRARLTEIPFRISISRSGEITLSSEHQQTPWRFTFQVNSQKNQIVVGFTLSYANLSIPEALEGANFYEGLVKGGGLLISARNPITGGYMPLVKGDVPSSAYKSNSKLVALLEHLRFIEIQTKSAFTFPSEPITVSEANDIAGIVGILKTGHATYTAKSWVSLTPLEEAKRVLESFKGETPQPTAVHFHDEVSVIFGEHIPLGPVTLFCDRTYVTTADFEDIQRQLQDLNDQETVKIRFTPFDDCQIEAQYLDWLSEDDATQLGRLPIYQPPTNADVRELKLEQININYALSLLNSWYAEDDQEQQKTWEMLRPALDEDRLSDRKLFT